MSFPDIDSRGVSIYGGSFQKAQTIHNHYPSQNDGAIRKLPEQHVVSGAMHDSADRYDPPKCHPETRIAVLDLIFGWINAFNNSEEPLMWLSGPAGAGKSAIAQSLAERCHVAGILAGTWFFSRTVPGRNEKTDLAPTLAYQLLEAQIIATIDALPTDTKIYEKSFRTQIEKLVIDPCLQSFESCPWTGMKVIIIDGLDECLKEESQKDILETIAYFAERYPQLPVRWLIASRPERQIRETFGQPNVARLTQRVILDDTYNPDADIQLFLTCKFVEIRSRHPHLPPSWPTAEAITKLVETSSGQFIYPAVVVRYVGSPRADPLRNLEVILRLASNRRKENPYAELDALYTYILEAVTSESLPIVMNILGKMMYVNEAWPTPSLPFYDKPWAKAQHSPGRLGWLLFNDAPMEIYLHLIDMHSLLEIPPQDQCFLTSIRIIHASFSDFLGDPARAGKFHISKGVASVDYVMNLLKHLLIHLAGPPHHSVYLVTSLNIKNCVKKKCVTWLADCPPSAELKRAFEVASDGTDEEYFAFLQSIGLEKLGPRRVLRLQDILIDERMKIVRAYLKKAKGCEVGKAGLPPAPGSSFHSVVRFEPKPPPRRNVIHSIAEVAPIFLSIATGVPMTAGMSEARTIAEPAYPS